MSYSHHPEHLLAHDRAAYRDMGERDIIVLAIETSCDETAVGIVKRNRDGTGTILANIILSQDMHAPFGGVVPELAARAHTAHLDRLVRMALERAALSFEDIDAIAATAGPGLLGGLIVGLSYARGLCLALNKPFIGVNHLEGHALTPCLSDNLTFPYAMVLLSGGHTQTLLVEGVGCYHKIATTLDDALGEAFDKVAKLLRLGYPGGVHIERHARNGDPERFSFPRPKAKKQKGAEGDEGKHFSFSGLKTAVRRTALSLPNPDASDIADICASFQKAAFDCVEDRVGDLCAHFIKRYPRAPRHLSISGGVGANRRLRSVLDALAGKHDFSLHAPPLDLCGDNAAMIAWVGAQYLIKGQLSPLSIKPRARWALDMPLSPAP